MVNTQHEHIEWTRGVGLMNLIDMSDADLMALATTQDVCEADDHDGENCLACQAWAVWESRDASRVVR